MKSILAITVLVLFFKMGAYAQNFDVYGKVVDSESLLPLPNVYISLSSLTNKDNKFSILTDADGAFKFSALNKKEKYRLKASSVSFTSLEMEVESWGALTNLGTLKLSPKENAIDEIVINATPATAIQKGDTLEMNANAFKTNRDASAEELVKKMPGITVENNNVKANGQNIKRILVDGKDFFGEDPAVALKNLPAEIIEKIQIFDKLSEQAQFTGFDDGMSDRAINIVTRKDKQTGQFGRLSAGSDFSDRYLLGGNYNRFTKNSRLSVIGLLNNVNQQNFAQQDMLAVAGSSKSKGDGGFVVNQQNGVNTTRSIGFNFSSDLTKKLSFTGSYFFNSNSNYTQLVSHKDKFLSPKADHFSTINDTLETDKSTHRFHLRFEYAVDSANSIIATPMLTVQASESSDWLSKLTSKDEGSFVNSSNVRNRSGLDGYAFENELVYKHKFKKNRRTVSLALLTLANKRKPYSTQIGSVLKSAGEILDLNQNSEGSTSSQKIGTNIVYIEPIGESSMLHFTLRNAYTQSERTRNIREVADDFTLLDAIDTLSNHFQTGYSNHHAGLSYRIKNKNLKFSLGLECQYAKLDVSQISPKKLDASRAFKNILPEMQLTLKYPKSSLQFLYKTSTDAPSISQLQNQIDISDKTNISTGNPYLTQEYLHNLSLKYSYANTDNSLFYTFYLTGDYKNNFIGVQTITAARDTFLRDVGVLLLKNMDLSRPVNIDRYTNLRSVFSFSFPAKLIKSKLNLSLGAAYSQTPAYINQSLNRYSLISLTNGVSLSSDWGENLDFTLSYNFDYSMVRNSILTSSVEANNNPNFKTQTLGVRLNWILPFYFVVQGEAAYQKENGYLDYNKDYMLLNLSFGKKIFKNKSGEIKIGVFDLPNKNQNLTHTVTPQYLLNSQVYALTRYYMLTFTYTIRGVDAAKTGKKEKKTKEKGF